MKRELKEGFLGNVELILSIARLIPMKRELKDFRSYMVWNYSLIARLIPMKRELKAQDCLVGLEPLSLESQGSSR